MLPTNSMREFRFLWQISDGPKEQKARWKRCVAATDGDLGEALGKAYVDKTFGADGKQRTLDMVHNIEAAMGQDLQTAYLDDAATKKQAMEKLHAMTNKIGYPDKWRDYSALKIVRGDAWGTRCAANEFEFDRQIEKIGKPVDRLEWGMTPPTVNAYYDPQMNNINFPAGILQPPFFDKQSDDAMNYGAIGAVIGHELTHGFDDQGRQFDAERQSEGLVDGRGCEGFRRTRGMPGKEYSSFDVARRCAHERQADAGREHGRQRRLAAGLDGADERPGGQDAAGVDGYTEQQRFFLGWGQIWCENIRRKCSGCRRRPIRTRSEYRVNGVVSNMPEFQRRSAVRSVSRWSRENACRVW